LCVNFSNNSQWPQGFSLERTWPFEGFPQEDLHAEERLNGERRVGRNAEYKGHGKGKNHWESDAEKCRRGWPFSGPSAPCEHAGFMSRGRRCKTRHPCLRKDAHPLRTCHPRMEIAGMTGKNHDW